MIQYDYSGDKNQLWLFCEPNNITSSSSEVEWSIIPSICVNFRFGIMMDSDDKSKEENE